MKRIALLLAVVASLFLIPAMSLAAPAIKYTICHATSSEGNPYVTIKVPEDSSLTPHLSDNEGNNPLAGHEQDLLFEGDVDCPGGTTTTTTTDETTTTTESTTTDETTTTTDTTTTTVETTTDTTTDTTTGPEIAVFAAEPDVCRFEGDESRIVIRRLAGILLLRNLDLYIDGDLITAEDIAFDDETNEARIIVAPGVHSWAVVDPNAVGGPETLAEGEVDCPDCFGTVVTTTTSGTPPDSNPTPPSTDTASGSTPSVINAGMLLVMAAILSIALVVGSFFAPNRRR